MTSFRTVVVFTAKLCVANLSTTEASVVQIANRARNLLLFLSTMTFVFKGFLAIPTCAIVALLLTRVYVTVQGLFTGGIAKNLVFLAALHRFGGPSAAAASLDHRMTRWTRPGMTKLCTCMLAKFFPATKFPAGMGHVAPVVLRVPLLATETVIFPWNLLRHVLACRTTPPVVGFRTAGPFGRTGQMQNVVAVRTRPNGLCRANQIATNETLQLGGIQLPDQFLALRALGDNLRFELLLAGPIPLISIWSPVFYFNNLSRSIVVIVTVAINYLGLVSIMIGPLITPITKTSNSSASLPSVILLTRLLLRSSKRPIIISRKATIHSFVRWPSIFPTILPRFPPLMIVETTSPVSPKSLAISVAIIPATVSPLRSIVLLPHSTGRSITIAFVATTVMRFSRANSTMPLLPAWNKLCSSWFQTRACINRYAAAPGGGISRTLDGRPGRELRYELLEALMGTGSGWSLASAGRHLRRWIVCSVSLFSSQPRSSAPQGGFGLGFERSSQW